MKTWNNGVRAGMLAAGMLAGLLGLAPASRPSDGSDEPRRLRGVLSMLDGPPVRVWGEGGVPAFDGSLYEKKSPGKVVWKTPSFAQTLTMVRPAATRPSFEKGSEAWPAAARVGNGELRWFAFEDSFGDVVPGLLAVPVGRSGRLPLVVVTHGLLSQKMQVMGQVGADLLDKGFAVLAIDLPLHGERPGWGLDILDAHDPAKMAGLWRKAVVDIREAVDVAMGSPVVDGDKGVVLVGYSLGSWMSVIAGAADGRVKALALLVGGATEIPDRLLSVKEFASSDPRVAVAAFAPRPVLLVSGREDRTISEAMADRLFAAAKEPKEHRWYEMGHVLREPALREAADWVGKVDGGK